MLYSAVISEIFFGFFIFYDHARIDGGAVVVEEVFFFGDDHGGRRFGVLVTKKLGLVPMSS